METSAVPGRKKAEKSAISEALRAEIIRIATEGSIEDDGALTPQVLSRIVGVAKTGRDVLVAVNVSPNNLAALIKKRRRMGLYQGGDDYDLLGDDVAGEVVEGGMIGNVLAPSPLGENFGMVALRELIAGMRQVNQSPDRLVEALATARRHGLEDVAKKLEEQLGLTAGAELPTIAPTADVEVKISFPNGRDNKNDFPNGEDGNDIPPEDDSNQQQAGGAP